MRFYLCGGLDAPDWILANIVTLSSIPSAKVKVLVEYIIQRISEGVFDYENALKITTDASLGHTDAVVRPYWLRRESLQTKLLQETLQLPALEIKAWQTLGEKKNVIMRLKSSIDYTKQETDESEDIVVCMTAEKFRVLHHELKAARALMDAYI
nr:COMM domain-containing protein 4-like isoform X2 [Physcomitrium patens]|eukprot:XP_024360664.1 COMM domain-containing protein 4-like isoform X2 [Physcomitrella patens]